MRLATRTRCCRRRQDDRKNTDAAVGEGEEEFLGVDHRLASSAAECDARGAVERAFEQNNRWSACAQRPAEDFGIADGARHEAQVVDLENVRQLVFAL